MAELFPDEDYRFHMRFEHGTTQAFFGPTPRHQELIAQRCHWLQTAAETYAAFLPEAAPLLDETIQMARSDATVTLADPSESRLNPWQRCLELGRAWEPDFLLLRRETGGQVRLVGGCVCFPSSWRLEEKIGHPIETIHGVVPGLNASIGNQIQGFLTKLRPGTAWLRANWGLSRSIELNQHPSRNLPRLDSGVQLNEVWLRVEEQALAALPQSGGVLFGIRIATYSLTEIVRDQRVCPRVIRALRTIPGEMAAYKNISGARARIISLLENSTAENDESAILGVAD